ncbi:MAG: hypothetical protein SF053_20480 [Bacteroidia bacterium]|nr:hypothetical protein [Bacteroidia bacterium]
MSILTDNRNLALQAYTAFADIPQQKEAVKHYLNAVQQTLLKLETQGMRRCMLYITSQMGKKQLGDNKSNESICQPSSFSAPDAYSYLYRHLSNVDTAAGSMDTFQYRVLKTMTEGEVALFAARVSFFLLCLKRLASTPEMQ